MVRKYVVVYYKNIESGSPGGVVFQSRAIDRLAFPESVDVKNLSPKLIEWDYAVIEERFYREEQPK